MRTLFLSLLCLFGALTVLQAQDPGIAYQAVARDADGDPLADAELDVRVTLYGADDAVLWQENHASVLTNQFGNLALTIGDGAVTPGYNALSAVDWSAAGLHFGIEVDAGAGYASFGDVDVEAVPIAMYALNGQEEEIAALQTQLDALDGNVSALTSGLSDAITESVNQDAYLLGLIQDNDGDISVLQSSVAANTADLGDLLSVITVGTNGITVEDLNVTGDLDITGVFSAATGLFNYLSANNADFEDMIAEAAQVEQMTFFEGRALGANSSLDVDGTLNVDGAATLADLTINGEQAATQPYVDSADAVNAQAIQDEAATRANADNDLQGQIDANDGDIAALQSADLSLGQSIAANETAIAENASALAANAAADAAESAAGAAADADLAAADADLSAALAANAAADAAESAAGAAADAALAAYDAAQDSVSAVVVAQAYADLAANAAADAAESAAGSAADADLQGQITSNDAEIAQANSDISANAADVADNEFRIAASAADMGFVESTVGSVNNVPTHPGYDGANYVAADANMVAADMALDAALNSAQADIDQNEADGDTADADLAAALAANAAADATESAAGAAADAALAAYDAAQDSVSAVVVAQAYADLAANAAADAANATADAIESAAGAAADAALAAYDAAQDSVSAVVVAQAYADLAANAAADAAESAAGTAADAALAAYDAAQDSVSAVVVAQAYADLAANAAADAAESSAGALADADLQTQIDDNAASSVAADATLSGQILANDDDIALLDLQLEAEAQMRLIADINNQQQSQINANAIANEISDRTDADNALDAYDAYLLGLIEGTANTPLDVANILEGLDYFEHDGNTVSLEAPYNALEAGSMMASTASFNAMDAQDIDVDDAEIQNVTVETNIYSPAGTIDQMNSTDLTVYVSSDLQGAVSAGSTLDVSGETTLGADVSVTGDVTVSGNVTAADATAANHLASFGQMTTADQALQADIDGNELDSDNADDQLQTNIDANATADAAESLAGDVSDQEIQDDVDANQTASELADTNMQADIDGNELDSDNADDQLQTNIDDNAASSVAADATLSGQIIANDDDIALLDLQLEAEAQMRLIADINNQQQSQINANAIANEISDRTDADNALDAYDAYLLGLIEGTANTPLDVANILEGLDYFEHDGNTVSLEAPYNALEAGSMMASTASFNAMDAQDIDVDDAEIQNVTVETNIYSPAGTIDQMNSTDLTVYVSSDLQGAVSAGSTLDVSGETTLGDDVSVTGDVTVSGNVTAADATAANHLASFGQMTTADQGLQADIDQNELDSDNADDQLQTNIDANATADAAESLAGDVSDQEIQDDVDANQTASELADTNMQADIDGNELDSDNADDQLQTNIDANATADAAESLAGDVSDQEIQDDVDANQTASELADTNMQADIDGNELDSDNADDQLQTNIDANATADAAESLAGDVSDQEIQDDVDANQTASELADTNMQADIDQNELDSDNADAAIHDLLYWNLGEDTFDDTQMELTLDAGIDAIDLGNSDLYTDQVTASSVGAMNGNFTDLVSYDANIDQLGANEINAGTVIAQQVRWTDAIGWGTGSTTDLQGTLNVDGATTMAAITADGAANLQAGLNVDGATTMDDLMADGNVDFNGDLLDVDAATSVDISSPLIDLSADVEMDLSAPRVVVHTSDFDLEGPLDVNGFTELDGLNVDGATTMDAMTADGLVTVNGNADINGNADVSGTLGVGGDVTMSSNAQVTGDLNVDGATTVDEITADGDADINGDADVSGTLNAGASTLASATITGDASVGGNTTMTGDASVGGNATVTGTLNAGASTLASATVTGHTELDGGLNVDGATTMDGLTVDGDIDLNGSIDVMDVLDVHGRAYFNELVDVHQGIAFFDQPQGNTMYLAPSGDITSQGSISMDGNAMFGGNANVTGTLDVTGTSTLGVVNAGATSTTTLTATGAAQLGDGLNVDGATTMDALTTSGDLDMDGAVMDVDMTDAITMDANTIAMNGAMSISLGSDDIYVNGINDVELTAGDDIQLTAIDGIDMSSFDLDIDASDDIDVHAARDIHIHAGYNAANGLDDENIKLEVDDENGNEAIMTLTATDMTLVGADVDLAQSLTVQGNAGINGNANVTGTLDVTGTSTLGVVNAGATSTTTLTATGAAQLGDGLNVDGATTMDQLTANGDVLMDGVFTTINSMEFRAFTNTVDIDAANVFELDAGQVSVDAFFDITMSANTIQLNTGNFDVNGPADVSGPTNLQSTLTVAGTTTSNGDLTVNANSDLNGTLDVSGNTDIDGTLDAQGATNLQSTLTVAGTTTSNGDLTVNANSDLNGTLDVSGNTDIDGTLDVQGATNLQSTLVVAGTTTSNGDLTVNANSDLNGTADVEGDFSVNTDKFVVTAASGNTAIAGTTTSEGDLTVNANSDLNGTLNVEGDATFQEDVIVEDNVFTNTAGNAGTVFTIHNSQGAAAITVETSDDALAMGGSATTLTTPRLIVQEDANYNGDMTVSGSLSVTDNIISAAAPTSPNHMANKQYVDNAVLNAVYAPEAYSYDAIESVHPGDVIYYINGDLLLYATGQTDNYNYVIQLTGSKLNDTDVTGAKLFARGNELNLFTSPTTDWQWGTGDSDASFKVGYNHIHALAGDQVDGYVSCSLVLYDAAGNGHNSGLTLRFYLDELNPVATATTFTE